MRAILAQPDEDTPRLVYADCLEENDQPERAEFIRVQCELARLEQREIDPDRRANHACRSRELLDTSVQDPRADNPLQCSLGLAMRYPTLRIAIMPSLAMCEFSRGFIDLVACDADDWANWGDEILTQHPVRRVALLTMPTMRNRSSSRNDDDIWLSADSIRKKFSANAVVARVRKAGDGNWGLALMQMRWPRVQFLSFAELPLVGLSQRRFHPATYEQFAANVRHETANDL